MKSLVRLPWQSTFWLNVPGLGSLLQKLFIAQWARRLQIGLTAGLDKESAIKMAASFATEPWVRVAMTRLQAVLPTGTSVSAQMQREVSLPGMIPQAIGVSRLVI